MLLESRIGLPRYLEGLADTSKVAAGSIKPVLKLALSAQLGGRPATTAAAMNLAALSLLPLPSWGQSGGEGKHFAFLQQVHFTLGLFRTQGSQPQA